MRGRTQLILAIALVATELIAGAVFVTLSTTAIGTFYRDAGTGADPLPYAAVWIAVALIAVVPAVYLSRRPRRRQVGELRQRSDASRHAHATGSDIAFPRGTQRVTVHHAPVAWHRFDADTFGIGRTEHALPVRLSIGLYSAERTLIDVFRLRHAWDSDLAFGALKWWLRGRGNSPGALLTMTENFPKARPAIQQALEVLL